MSVLLSSRVASSGVTSLEATLTTAKVSRCSVDVPPSRKTNPFATCWTAPGKLPYVEAEGNSVTEVLGRLEREGGWGAIVGPHGSGKSALLHAIEASLREQGRQVAIVHLAAFHHAADGRPRLVDITPAMATLKRPLWLLEGFERLGWVARQRVLRQCCRRKVDVIATLHGKAMVWPWRLPAVATLAPTQEQIKHLFDMLIEREPTPLVSWRDALQALGRSEGNLREFWFALYLLHEKRRRQGTGSPASA